MIDAGTDPFSAPLWSIPQPDWFRKSDAETRAIWADDPPGRWSFWTRWWDGVLSGQQIDWELQKVVALIEPAVWDADPDAVAEAIAGIDRSPRMAVSRALDAAIRDKPFAINILVDATTSRFVAVEIRIFDLDQIIGAVELSLADFTRRTKDMMKGNKPGFALQQAVSPAIKELRRDLKRHRRSPLFLHDAISDAIHEARAAAVGEGVHSEPVFQRLVLTWARCQTELCAASPELLETVQRRTMVQVALFTGDQVRQALSLGEDLRDLSCGVLQAAASFALQAVADPSASIAQKQSAWYFLASALPRGAQAALQFEERRT